MAYQVKLKMEVTDYKGNSESLVKSLTLPFPPYIGLQIALEQGESGNPTGPIRHVIWNQYGERFICEVAWRYPADYRSDGDIWTMESHLACALSDGWEME